jgi:hypothetical protein
MLVGAPAHEFGSNSQTFQPFSHAGTKINSGCPPRRPPRSARHDLAHLLYDFGPNFITTATNCRPDVGLHRAYVCAELLHPVDGRSNYIDSGTSPARMYCADYAR